MGAQFTPGPWRVTERDGRLFVTAPLSPDSGIQVYIALAGAKNADCPETAANANLMAAATDLYEALRLFLEDERFQVAIGGNPAAVEAMLAQASAALALARDGRQA